MLKIILSVSGKPGLFKLISNAKNMVIVESLADKKRIPIYARDKVVSLGDIAMYTDEAEVPLREVLSIMKAKENGQPTTIKTNSKPEELRKYFAEILPTYDRERVYDSDIKKLITWYNLLIQAEIPFEEEDVPSEESTSVVEESKEEAPVVEAKKEIKKKAPAKAKKDKEAK